MYSFLLNWIGRVESSRISFTRNSDKVRHRSRQEEKFYVEPRSTLEERNVGFHRRSPTKRNFSRIVKVEGKRRKIYKV